MWIGIIWGYSLVFSTNFVFTPETKFFSSVSPNIYLWDETLSSTIIWYKSTHDISSAVIHSTCETKTTFLEKDEGVYYFALQYLGDTCRNKNIILKHEDELIIETSLELNIVTEGDVFNLMTDHSTSVLQKFYRTLQQTNKKYKLYENVKSEEVGKYMTYRKRQRKFQESTYQHQLLQNIIYGRLQKYISPVPEKQVSEQYSKIPNSGRPYRADYTDGIHHGWDIDGEVWEEVVALDDWYIVRIVEGFEYEDLWRILRGTLTEDEELRNLDILRGNQVWLKTTKGEIVFYSHLDNVYDTFQEWDIVEKGTKLWTIGVSGVPEKGYDDYHLHFAIQTNPFDSKKAGTYDFSDYMKWDWKFKGETFEYIIENQKEIFE